METIVVAGIGSAVGANLALALSGRFRVVGLSFSGPVTLEGCETGYCLADDEKSIQRWIQAVGPDGILYCGAAAESTWSFGQSSQSAGSPGRADIQAARLWATAARAAHCRLTVISSDAVFTGPWMFHKENSTCLCDSLQAETIRNIEQVVARLCPGTLIVRTNAYGWAPESAGPGRMETLLDDLNGGTAGPFDFQRHSTPILATDLGEILCRAFERQLDGIVHVAGAERVNPNQFVDRLADEFGLPAPQPVEGNTLQECVRGFGCGETSLHTSRIRNTLGIPMPTLWEGLQRLREQKHNGYCDRLAVEERTVQEQVA